MSTNITANYQTSNQNLERLKTVYDKILEISHEVFDSEQEWNFKALRNVSQAPSSSEPIRIRLLDREEQDKFHLLYRKNDLFMQWSPLMCKLEWEIDELDGITLWRIADQSLQQLRLTLDNRDEIIPYIFKRLPSDFKKVEYGDGEYLMRTMEQTEHSAVTVMCLMLTSLMNAVERGHECDAFCNQAMCVAIVGLLRCHQHFQFLMSLFFGRKKGNNGQDVVITPFDPMNPFDEVSKLEQDKMTEVLICFTNVLHPLFSEHWGLWIRLCRLVCQDLEMLEKLNKVEPRNNDWGINQKMVCNMISMFVKEHRINVSINAISKQLSCKHLNSYLRNHADYQGTDTALDKACHLKMEKMIGQDKE